MLYAIYMTLNLPKRLPVDMPAMPTLPKGDDLTPEATFIRVVAQSINMATLLNDNNFGFYSKACQFWQESFEWFRAMKQTNPTPRPTPPMAYTAAMSDVFGLFHWTLTNSPLAEPCLDPSDPPAPSSYIGNHIYGDYYVSLAGDPTLDGQEVTESRGTFTFRKSPFGGWYILKH